MTKQTVMLIALLFSLGCGCAQAENAEPSAIIEIGTAGSWGLKGGSAYGPNFSVETTPIEDVLEIEGGVTPLLSRSQTEWDADFLFKKPWTLSETVEFMAGIGPEWAHTLTKAGTTDTVGLEVAGDFMFWPWAKREYGLYLEPSYDYSFGHDHEQGVGVSMGLLIPIP